MKSDGKDYAVSAENLGKRYKIYPTSFARFKEAFYFGKRGFHMPVWALREVSLEVPKGKALGLIGSNGAGKSTFLKILSGTTLPTTGSFKMNGKVSSLLELGTGFHSEFSGRSNIFLNGAVHGFTRRDIAAKVEEILDFAELGEFIDQPIRTYSSGMVMRLGFSMATAIDPEILIIDEILAVGDLHFQKKCVDRIFKFKKEGKSIIFCSHSLYDIRQVCDEVAWFKDGRIEERGDPLAVTNNYANYERSLATKEEIYTADFEVLKGEEQPHILSFSLIDSHGNRSPEFVRTGDNLTLEVEFEIKQQGQATNVAVAIFRTDNVLVSSFSSFMDGKEPYKDKGLHRVTLRLPDFRIAEGEYNLVAYVFDENGIHVYDHTQTERSLIVQQEENRPGLIQLHYNWDW
ncbi:MAG: ABC transporter ATP-binding protein [Planctomycetota bacterium]|jgi:ABC-type polysaccharide/polyol phosphate transport system ATPase subunit